MSQNDLESRILDLLDGNLAAGEAAELEALLLRDEGARETYLALVAIHNGLESRFTAASTVQQMSIIPIDRLVAAQQRRVIRGSLIAAAAILVISAVSMWMILAPKTPATVATLRTTSDALVSLSYEGDGEAPEGNTLVAGSRLRLTHGTMEGSFKNGARLVAEAPCDLRVISDKEVSLESGRAWFLVPPEAKGFTVDTRQLTVVDLGTEFGVASAIGGSDEAHVIKGTIEVTARHHPADKKLLKKGEALRTGPDGQLIGIKPNPSQFETKTTETRAIGIANHSFEEDVIPRDGKRATKTTGNDDYNKDLVPSGWTRFDDGEGDKSLAGGIISTANDSFFNQVLAPTPDGDPNDQTFYSAERDLFQVLSEKLQPNSTYVLSVDIGDWLKVQGYDGAPGNPGIHLGTGGRPGEALLTASATDFPTRIDGRWVRWTATYQTGPKPKAAGQPLRVELTSGSRMAWFDNVCLSVRR